MSIDDLVKNGMEAVVEATAFLYELENNESGETLDECLALYDNVVLKANGILNIVNNALASGYYATNPLLYSKLWAVKADMCYITGLEFQRDCAKFLRKNGLLN